MTPSNPLLERYSHLVPYFEPVPVFNHRLWMFETADGLYPYEIRIKEIEYASTMSDASKKDDSSVVALVTMCVG